VSKTSRSNRNNPGLPMGTSINYFAKEKRGHRVVV
jgi:hypothetical protein